MKKIALSFACALALCGGAAAQVVTSNGTKSDAVVLKIHQIDILNELLPLTLRKEQFPPILLALEKARSAEKKILEDEDAQLAKIAPDIDKAYDDGVDKGVYPSHDIVVNTAKLLKAMAIRRQVFVGETMDDMYKAVDSTLDAGQKKVMANTVTMDDLPAGIKKEDATDEMKIKAFVRKVFLDRAAYDILLKLRNK